MKIKQGMILAFGEIFLKSAGVQRNFKQKLIHNLDSFLKSNRVTAKVYVWHERIFVETKNQKKVATILKNTFGLVWFAQTFFLEKASLSDVSNFIKKNYQDWIKPKQSFALRVKKDSGFKKSRQQIIEKIAAPIERKVDLTRPKKEIFIEVRKAGWFVYFKKQKAAGGLPGGSQGKVLALISGGIDSLPASYLMAKRGAENIWLHFHSYPLVSQKSIAKTKELAKVFLNYQPKLKVHFVPLADIQKKIKANIEAKYRVLLYRKIMLKIAQKIAGQENCQALITGESLGQVSSQTLPNLGITQEGLKIPVLRPCIGLDKEEIISLAKQIQTFEISIKPQEDCCTLFVPKHQSAAAKIDLIKSLEKKLKLTKLMANAIKSSELEIF